ncbi:hypothetical protein LPJ55_003892 [Coemansia sp. RSA 990]|nr:hypothetical protein LPJ68_003007 [Coemansia sp. RSA 1086]KAJ1749505.1 hypothetical protein LPJ79_003655 [Coemansia sp. RSA 1821]KAJ1871413.1 hypothetical protein LPJ55_003892 [Coemansia sp. RSA 990]
MNGSGNDLHKSTPADVVSISVESCSLEREESVGMLTKLGVCLVMFLIGLYTMMDSVLYVPIANEFNSLSRSEWIINGYLITTTALQPIYGKGSDILGRKPAIMLASSFLLVGSIISAVSQSMDLLIASRAIQGIGSAGLYTMINVVVADLFNERDRALFMGISSFIWGISSAGGIILGGTLVQLSTWRVAFWINVPICHKVPIEPILPLQLLKTRNVALALVGHLFFGAVTYAPVMFIPQWALVVKNTTPITSGLYTLPFTIPESFAAIIAGYWVTRSGQYRECVWLGSVFLLAGLTPLIILDQYSGLGRIIGFQIIAGVGFGMCIQTLILTAQASSAGSEVASATATCLFMRSLGAILVVAVLASVNGNRLTAEFAKISNQYPKYHNDIQRISANQSLIHQLDLPPELFNMLVNAFMKGMRAAFIALIPFSAIFVLIVAAIKHVPLQQTKKA